MGTNEFDVNTLQDFCKQEQEGETLVHGIEVESFEYQRKRAISFAYHKEGIKYKIDEDTKTIYVRQYAVLNYRLYNNKELYEKARFWHPDKSYKIQPLVYEISDAEITPLWIEVQMELIGLNRKDLMKQLGLTQSEVSLFLTGKRPMSRGMRAMFYYYFLSYKKQLVGEIGVAEVRQKEEIITIRLKEQANK